MQYPDGFQNDIAPSHKSKPPCKSQEYRDSKILSSLSTANSVTSVLDQELSSPVVESSSICSVSASTISSAPICRQFWKSGIYDDSLSYKSCIPKGSNYLHIHPKFLHSNATSHKWAFGAIAELIDNAVDEVQNGATYVIIDKILNPRDGSTALLVQDDGGGMNPEAMRHCLSFGFSDKKSKTAIGQYGNGFKTSSMRLGSDVIVFTRHLENRKLTQSIGLLSYTFLMQTGHDRIVVPMVDYEFNNKTNTWNALNSDQHNSNNLSLLLQWSPYSSEDDLLKQFEDIGNHGTKIIVFNLWHNNDGNVELDFKSDSEDIRISGTEKRSEKRGSNMALYEQHLASRLRFSLRAYLSILYLRVPDNFSIRLRGRQVEFFNIASNLKFRECILYTPYSGTGLKEGEIITAIGFLKEAPLVNIHGFSVYHKNRLILPYWQVTSSSCGRGRGVVGVLEANFIQPTHNKQDFEKTSVFQKLEHRLKEMTFEYWDYHCRLIGYKVKRKPRMMTCQVTPDSTQDRGVYQPVHLSTGSSSTSKVGPNSVQNHGLYQPVHFSTGPSSKSQGRPDSTRDHGLYQPVHLSTGPASRSQVRPDSTRDHGLYQPVHLSTGPSSGSQIRPDSTQDQGLYQPVHLSTGPQLKRKEHDDDGLLECEKMKRKIGLTRNAMASNSGIPCGRDEACSLLDENKKLKARYSEHERVIEELQLKAAQLRVELSEEQSVYSSMFAESKLLQKVKEEHRF